MQATCAPADSRTARTANTARRLILAGQESSAQATSSSHRVLIVLPNGRQQLGLEQEAQQALLNGTHAVHRIKLALLQQEQEAVPLPGVHCERAQCLHKRAAHNS